MRATDYRAALEDFRHKWANQVRRGEVSPLEKIEVLILESFVRFLERRENQSRWMRYEQEKERWSREQGKRAR